MPRVLEDLLDRAWRALDDGNLVRARSLARRAARDPSHRGEARHLLGRIALERDDPRAALVLLEQARAAGGDSPDLFYDLGIAHELLGHERERVAAFLEVHARDPEWDVAVGRHLDEDALVAEAEQVLAELPDEILSRLGPVPIIVEDRPTRDLVEEGFDPRALGLFDGPPWSEQGASGPALNRIVLYRVNIAASTASAAEAREEVRITLLHETAHFFGLEEADMERFGLD